MKAWVPGLAVSAAAAGGGGFTMEDIFSQFGDIFGGHFGGGGGFGGFSGGGEAATGSAAVRTCASRLN